jgi:demethylmenaquinone methyltransferase/2-methoxy-6-polyprenyl-1,4-benzoquinol methylase
MANRSADPGPRPDDITDFGYRRVLESEKPSLVRDLFDNVARRYDLMNDLMSGGVHRLWKGAMIDWLAPRRGLHLVDLAGGTGDIAFRVLDRVGGPGHGRVTVCDLSAEMVTVGRTRAWDRGLVKGLDWVCGDAECLPLAKSSADAVTIAFGIRNVTHIDAVLAEARRVLKPGGRFMCLEFCPEVDPMLAPLYERYSFTVLPWLGGLVQGDRDAYAYLAESIRRFPTPAHFAALIEAAGLDLVKVRRLSGGVAALHSAWRL